MSSSMAHCILFLVHPHEHRKGLVGHWFNTVGSVSSAASGSCACPCPEGAAVIDRRSQQLSIAAVAIPASLWICPSVLDKCASGLQAGAAVCQHHEGATAGAG
jgi:hypothetical protein